MQVRARTDLGVGTIIYKVRNTTMCLQASWRDASELSATSDLTGRCGMHTRTRTRTQTRSRTRECECAQVSKGTVGYSCGVRNGDIIVVLNARSHYRALSLHGDCHSNFRRKILDVVFAHLPTDAAAFLSREQL